LLIVMTIVHFVQTAAQYIAFGVGSIKYLEAKAFASIYCKLTTFLGILHVSILVWAIIVGLKEDIPTCERKFLPAIYNDIILGFLSIPLIALNYAQCTWREKINEEYQL